jgi:hypothetical protein
MSMAKRKNRQAVRGSRPAAKSGDSGLLYDGLCCLLLVAICLAVGLPRYLLNIDMSDEGFLGYGAVRVMEGQLPHRDFMSLQPPLSFYTVAAVFKLLGVSLHSMRVLGLLLYVIIILALYGITRQRSGRIVALAAALPAAFIGMPLFNFTPFAVWQGIAASMLSCLFMIRGATTGRRSLLFGAGFMAAMAAISRHDQGIYMVLASTAYMLLLQFRFKDDVPIAPARMFFVWFCGLLAPLVPLGIFWLASGAIPSMFRQLVLFPLTSYAKTSSLPLPRFNADLTTASFLLTLLFYIPPVLYLLMAAAGVLLFLRGRRKLSAAHVAFMLLVSLLFYCQALTRSDFYHLLITLSPFFITCAWAAAEMCTIVGRWIRGAAQPLAACLLAAAGLCFVAVVSPAVISKPVPSMRSLQLPRGGVMMDSGSAASLEDFTGFIENASAPNRSILCLPYCPMLYFLTARRNPTRWNYLWPGDQTPQDYLDLIGQAEKDFPAVIIISKEENMRLYAGALLEWVHVRYKLLYHSEEISVYMPPDPKS